METSEILEFLRRKFKFEYLLILWAQYVILRGNLFMTLTISNWRYKNLNFVNNGSVYDWGKTTSKFDTATLTKFDCIWYGTMSIFDIILSDYLFK